MPKPALLIPVSCKTHFSSQTAYRQLLEWLQWK